MYLDTENNTPSEVYIMRKACLLAFTMLLLSCGGDTPTEPKKDYYCSGNYKTYATYEAYYAECPSMWCTYSNTYMTAYYFREHCTMENFQRSSSSQVVPSSSSALPQQYCCQYDGACYASKTVYDLNCKAPMSSSSPKSSSSVDVCPTNKCDCNPIYKSTYETMMKSPSYASMGEQYARQRVAQQVGCTL